MPRATRRLRREAGVGPRPDTRLGRPEVPGTSRRRDVFPAWTSDGPRSYGPAVARAGRDERAWVRGAQRGSASDLEALFRPLAARAPRRLSRRPRRGAAEDIAQEAFLAAIRALDRFDRRRPFGPWLHRIVVNRAIDWARARSLRARGRARPRRSPRARATRAGRQRRARGARAALPPEQRAVIVLRHLLEYTPGEIARAARPAARDGQLAPAARARRAAGGAVRRRARARAAPGRRRGRASARGASCSPRSTTREPVPRPRAAARGARGRARRRGLALAALASPPGRAVRRPRPRGRRRRARAAGAVLAARAGPAARRLRRRRLGRRRQDGSKRLLGGYHEASWSPFGRFVVASRANELAALEPDGDVRWTLARRASRSPRWTGTRDGHADRLRRPTGIRVVAGDGDGRPPARARRRRDRSPGGRARDPCSRTPPESELRMQDADTGASSGAPIHGPRLRTRLDWSTTDGACSSSRRDVHVFDARGRSIAHAGPDGRPVHRRDVRARHPSGRRAAGRAGHCLSSRRDGTVFPGTASSAA